MSRKRKTPGFSAIVLRVLELRFNEIIRVKLVSEAVIEMVLKSTTDTDKFIVDFDAYMVHLVSEFGEVGSKYTFRIFQSTKLRSELCYNDTNNLNELSVNLSISQQHDS